MKTFSCGLVLFCLTRTPIGWLKPILRSRFSNSNLIWLLLRVPILEWSSLLTQVFTFLAVILYSFKFYEFQVSLSNFSLKSFSESRSYSFRFRMIFRCHSLLLSNVTFKVAFSSFVFDFISSFSIFSFCISIFEFSNFGMVFLTSLPCPLFSDQKRKVFTFSVRKRSYLILQFWV